MDKGMEMNNVLTLVSPNKASQSSSPVLGVGSASREITAGLNALITQQDELASILKAVITLIRGEALPTLRGSHDALLTYGIMCDELSSGIGTLEGLYRECLGLQSSLGISREACVSERGGLIRHQYQNSIVTTPGRVVVEGEPSPNLREYIKWCESISPRDPSSLLAFPMGYEGLARVVECKDILVQEDRVTYRLEMDQVQEHNETLLYGLYNHAEENGYWGLPTYLTGKGKVRSRYLVLKTRNNATDPGNEIRVLYSPTGSLGPAS